MVVDGKEYDFHLLPSGIINPKAVSFIGEWLASVLDLMDAAGGAGILSGKHLLQWGCPCGGGSTLPPCLCAGPGQPLPAGQRLPRAEHSSAELPTLHMYA